VLGGFGWLALPGRLFRRGSDQESMLTTAYELLEKLPSGEFVWLATVERLADAERLLDELCTNSPDGNFVISDGNAEVCTPP